jgi:mannose-6-phosphate isomerase-like protein (cupin superfamily)
MNKTGSLSSDETVSVGGDTLTFRVTSDQSGGALTAVEVRMPAGGGPPMLHRHDPFELYRVERGELAFYVANGDGEVERTVAGPGAVVPIAGGHEHTIRNEFREEARALVIFSPGAGMERFAREAGALAQRGGPGMDEVLALAEAHGIEMTRPLNGVL